MSYARFPETAFRPVPAQLLPFAFEELEFFPGCLCNGRAHFDVDRFGGWGIFSIELDGYHGADLTLTQRSTGPAAVIFKLIGETLRDRYEDQILGNPADA